MRLGIISDIHSNIEALTTVLRWMDTQQIDEVICLGDIVGYGPDPNPCCKLIRENCSVSLMGNHDAAVIGVMDIEYYYDAAREAIYWTRQQLSDVNFQWLYSLPYTHIRENAGFYHAAPHKPYNWHYVVHVTEAMKHNEAPLYDRLKTWSFLGHSHLTKQFAINGKRAKDVTDRALQAKPDRKYLINVGSVGQPRDRDPRLCFGVYDSESETFEHIRLEYDIASTAQKIVSAGLAEKFARRLFVGQ